MISCKLENAHSQLHTYKCAESTHRKENNMKPIRLKLTMRIVGKVCDKLGDCYAYAYVSVNPSLVNRCFMLFESMCLRGDTSKYK